MLKAKIYDARKEKEDDLTDELDSILNENRIAKDRSKTEYSTMNSRPYKVSQRGLRSESNSNYWDPQ